MRHVCFLLFCCLHISIQAQKKTTKIEIINADYLVFDEQLGKGAKRLLGNVQMKHEDALMFCDSAYFYTNNSLDAFGRIRVLQGDSMQLYGDSLNYDGNTRIAKLKGNITLISPDMNLTTNNLDYNRKNNFVYYYGGGTLVNKKENNTLKSRQGYYYLQTRSFFFKKDVVLTNPEYTMKSDTLQYNELSEMVIFHGPTTIQAQQNFIYCETGWYDTRKDVSQYINNAYIISGSQRISGDTIWYDRKNGLGIITCFVTIRDTAEKLEITSDKAYIFEKKDSALITEHALMKQIFSEDTLFLHADTFIIQTIRDTGMSRLPSPPIPTIENDTLPDDSASVKNEDKRILYAFHHVKFYKEDMQGKCDSLVYSFPDSSISMYRNPILWSEANQLTADFIKIHTYDTVVHSLYLTDNAFIVSEVDSTRFNQIKGNNMKGHFVSNKLHTINVMENCESVYYAKDDAGKFVGVNLAESEKMRIVIDEDQIQSITYIGKPSATLYPLYELSEEELKLKGFRWLNASRPRDMFDVFLHK